MRETMPEFLHLYVMCYCSSTQTVRGDVNIVYLLNCPPTQTVRGDGSQSVASKFHRTKTGLLVLGDASRLNSTQSVHLSDRSALTVLCSAMLRQTYADQPGYLTHSVVTPGQPILRLPLQQTASVSPATRIPFFRSSTVWPEKIHRRASRDSGGILPVVISQPISISDWPPVTGGVNPFWVADIKVQELCHLIIWFVPHNARAHSHVSPRLLVWHLPRP